MAQSSNPSSVGTESGHDLLPPARRLGAATLTGLIYCSVCAGAYGMEPLVGAVGPGWAVLLIVLTPLVYSLPIAFMAAELTALMPDEGGYYIWVRSTLGRFWAVQEAWWTFLFGLCQLASFPVLFVAYLQYVLVHAGGGLVDPAWLAQPLVKWGIAAAMVASGTALNLFGALDVGRFALGSIALVLGVFATFLGGWALSGPGLAQSAAVIAQDLASNRHADLLLGLSVIVFNYSAWEKASSYAGEVDRPQRNYPIALGAALVLTVLSYLLPVLAGVGSSSDPALWSAEAGWPVIAERFGGPALGLALAVGGMVSMWSLFVAVLLWVSRIPAVLALDGWLPRGFAPSHGENAVPTGAVVFVAILTAALAAYSFTDLVVVQNFAYTGALVLEILALWILRRRLPDAPRAFRVPAGRWGLAFTCLAPLVFSAAVLYATLREGGADETSHSSQFVLSAALGALGLALYWAGRRRAGRAAAGAAQAAEEGSAT